MGIFDFLSKRKVTNSPKEWLIKATQIYKKTDSKRDLIQIGFSKSRNWMI
jgi:hypothetical protein